MMHAISIQGQSFHLHYTGALYWEDKAMLIISDVHLGKVSHFRKFGAAVPQKAVQKNFSAMDEALKAFKPNTVVFLGDLFHSHLNNEWKLFEDWIPANDCEFTLVSGNHDIISPLKYEELGIQIISELVQDGFLFTHHPEEREHYFNFSGHIHPAIRLNGLGRQSVRLSCFYKTQNQLILPAFGEFTGSYTMEPTEHCEIFALLGDAVLPVPIKIGKRKRSRF